MHYGAKQFFRGIALAAMLCVWALVGTVQAVEFDLQAVAFDKTMPDGRVVPMWGYYNPAAPGTIADQFPLVLEIPADDDTLIVNLTNNLPEFTSLQLSGFVDTGRTPVFFTDGNGQQRVQSFTNEAAANVGTASYTWTVDRPGTFLLQSASHVAAQAPMGLYAVVKKNAVDGDPIPTGEAYGPATAFQNEVVLLFSEVDPALNDAVVAGTFGTTYHPAADYEPRYFLINGDPFPFGDTHTYAGAIGENILVRFVNAGLFTRAPTVVGGDWRLVAEDGNPYTNERLLSSLDLTPGKTLDIIGMSSEQGYFPIYDRTLGLTNADTSTGGMLTYLEVGPDHATGGQALLTISKTGAGTVQSSSLPGGIICGPTCDNHYLLDTELRLTATPAANSVFAGWEGCTPITGLRDCLITLTADTTVTANFVQALSRIGVFRAGQWYVDKGALGWEGLTVDGHYPSFGGGADIPVAGDMNGDGFSEIGVYRPATGQWYFDLDGNGAWSGCGLDLCLAAFGAPTDLPVVGDWDGNGRDEVGVYRQGKWYFDTDGSGTWDPNRDAFRQAFGAPNDLPVAGDWNGDGRDEIGVYRQGTWYFDRDGNGAWNPAVDLPSASFGAPTDLPVVGDIDNNGIPEVGVFRPESGLWYFDLDNNGAWSGCGPDLCVPPFGAPTDKPVIGVWR